MATSEKRARGHRLAGHRPAGGGLHTPEAASWWQVRKRRRQRPGARRVEHGVGWDWGKFAAAVTSLTAIAALLFTGLSLQQTRQQNQLAQSGQITDRFNAAVTNLGSSNETIRIGGIYALQRIMQDSPRDQPAVIQVLTAFIREQAPRKPLAGAAPITTVGAKTGLAPAIDVQTALAVLVSRNRANDDGSRIDLESTNLSNANLTNADFLGADLSGSDLTGATLDGADIDGAILTDANLTHAQMLWGDAIAVDLAGANLTDADFSSSDLTGATLTGADVEGTNLAFANLTSVTLVDTDLYLAHLSGTNLEETPLCPYGKPARPAGYVCTGSAKPTGDGQP